MAKREAFLQAVCRDKAPDFLNFIQRHKDSTDPFDLVELLQELPEKQKEQLWEKLARLLTDTLQGFPMEKWSRGLDEDSGDEMEAEVPPALMETMSIIDGVTLVATASIAVVQEDVIYDGLLECAHVLNIVVGALPSSEAMVKISIQRFCESWWEKGLPGRENLGKTAFLMLLERNLLLRSSVADMKRLWNLHAVLLTFDFESEASEEVKDLLLQCFLSVQHIKREEGRRFLISLFSWNVNFIKMIHGTIKNQIQFFPKFIMEHVGEMYFRAWKKATGPFLEEIETGCLQDYMHHGVHLHRSSPVHAKVRQILSYFHNQKLRQGVDEMLFRLYQPILWRALKARNSEVRANAALLFTEAFPIQDPSFNNEAMDSAIQKQFEVLFSLLEDPQPLVRSTGILGVCRITSKYWEMIPPAILTDFLKKMVIDLAADVSCADVRCAVFKCMTLVVDNKLSHPLLEQLLPLLKNSLHDNSEKVRVAVVELLLKIKAVRAAKFWKVCTMEHLLARLETDSHSVARRLVNLLFNSFFPVNQSEEVWCERCVALIQMNPTAARRFYQYAHEHTAPTNIAKLMLMIRRCLNACIQQAGKEEQDETESSNKENSSILDDVLSITDTATMASLLEVIVILWRSIRRSLELNEEALQYTTSKFASILPEYFRVFKEERCTVPLMLIASFMPAAAVPTFSCGVLSKLRNLEKGAVESQYGTLIDCLCRWGQAGHVVEVVTDWLTDALPQKKSRADSERRVRILETAEAKPELALDYVEYMLTCTMNREFLLSVHQKKLVQLLKALGALKVVFYAYISSSEMGPCQIDKETAMRAYSLHGRLSIHLQHKYLDDRSYLQVLEKSAAWVAEKILPFLVVPSEDTVSDQQLTTTKQVVEDRLTVLRDVVMVGLADADFKGQALHFCIAVLHAEKGYMCVPSLLSLLKEVAEDCLAQSARSQSEELSVLLSVVANVFQKILEAAARRLQKQREEGLQLCHSSHMVLGEFLNVIQDWQSADASVAPAVFSTIVAALVVELSHVLQKVSSVEELEPPESVNDLPPLSSALLTVILRSPGLIRSLMREINESVESEAIDGVTGLTAVLYILAVVIQTKSDQSHFKDTAICIQRQLHKYYGVTAEDSRNIERTIYESSVKIVKEILLV
ncbi:condensin-2 complex subunit G2 isoform X2 [Amia ocellicauda]|uniref:condensin-2 complex subunit G2 isoform X2 n=1 Tax=Amia ocellicauda TaxID=2972642 RepID=UPI0034642730